MRPEEFLFSILTIDERRARRGVKERRVVCSVRDAALSGSHQASCGDARVVIQFRGRELPPEKKRKKKDTGIETRRSLDSERISDDGESIERCVTKA